MGLIIRFSNVGKRGERKYRIVVKEKRSKRDGRPVDVVGYYEKKDKNTVVKKIESDKLKYWLSKGALPTDSVKKII